MTAPGVTLLEAILKFALWPKRERNWRGQGARMRHIGSKICRLRATPATPIAAARRPNGVLRRLLKVKVYNAIT